MDRNLIITGVGTFSLGALMGWAITSEINKKKFASERASYDQMIKEKTDHIYALQERVEYQWAKANSAENEKDPNSPIFDDMKNSILETPLATIETIEQESETSEETKTNLQKLIDAYTANPNTQEDFDSMAIADGISFVENDKTTPFVISRAVYAWDEEGENFAKISLMYFPDDRVLLDDDEDTIENINEFVGWRSLTQFGGESEDPDVVFVRNRHMETDFEVIKEESSQLPLHVKYGMEKEEFRVNKAAGLIKLRQEDDDN